MGWTKKQLEQKGYEVVCPVIVDVWKAPYEQWKEELDKVIMSEQTILVGLSAGGYALLRYLGESGKNVSKVLLVAPGAPGTIRADRPLLPHEEEFYSYNITPQLLLQIRERVRVFVSNDQEFILQAVEIYKKVLNAEEIKLPNLGHFSFLMKELPELVEEIVR